MYPRSEILFPHRCIRGLRHLLDARWATLVDTILAKDQANLDSLAFSFAMIRLCGCMSCDMGSYKASLGCDICAQRAVLGTKGNSTTLLKRFETAREDITKYLENGTFEYSEDGADFGPRDQAGEVTLTREET
jgi:hypothetical protein